MSNSEVPTGCIILEFHQTCTLYGGQSDSCESIERIQARKLKDLDWIRLTDQRFCTKDRQLDILVEKYLLEKFSTYFRALNSFREADCKRISVDWDVSLFSILLKLFHCGHFDISASKVAALLETSVFFGVDEAIDRIKTWVTLTSSTKDPREILTVLKNLPVIWDASHRFGHSSLLNFCAEFLAINFMEARSMSTFNNIPHRLLSACVDHIQLTVYSEKDLLDSLRCWCEGQDWVDEAEEIISERVTSIMNKVRISLVPLCVLLAHYPSKNCLDCNNRTIRITHYLEYLDLSGCHEVDDDMLFQSSASAPLAAHCTSVPPGDIPTGHIIESPISAFRYREPVRNPKWPVIPKFGNLKTVNLSYCNKISEDAILLWLREACPQLTEFYAKNCPQIGFTFLPSLAKECPNLEAVDISLDIFNLEDSNIYKISTEDEIEARTIRRNFLLWGVYPMFQLTSLSLRGRSEVRDNVFNIIAANFRGLVDLDVSNCRMLTDNGLSEGLKRLPKGLHSLRAQWTSFGPEACKELSSPTNIMIVRNDLHILDLESCHGLTPEGIASILKKETTLSTLNLGDTTLNDFGLYLFKGRRLRKLCVRDTKVTAKALSFVLRNNPGLTSLDVKGCKSACIDGYDLLLRDTYDLERRVDNIEIQTSPHSVSSIFQELESLHLLEDFEVGWRFSLLALEAMKPSSKRVRRLVVGVGGGMCNMGLQKISNYWPSLERLSLCFQIIDDDGIIQIVDGLRSLQILEIQNTISHLTPKGVAALVDRCPPKLVRLKLDRVATGMSDGDLLQLSKKCNNLASFSLVGCTQLTASSLVAISQNMRALTELKLEECDGLTSSGAQCILDSCKALERLTLRHNGKGLEDSFVMKAKDELPYLWFLSLDMCDSVSCSFETPELARRERPLNTVLLSRCNSPEEGIFPTASTSRNSRPKKRTPRDTIVLRWTRDLTLAYSTKTRI
ncbi:hypothetical protein Mapa_013221 [Marchantia paleacea]|nr:hypothetical protein Mapa_013221 [Marchantia paleacea]